MKKEQIKAILMAHGFTIKEGQDDLKPYVYEAATALLVAQPYQYFQRLNLAEAELLKNGFKRLDDTWVATTPPGLNEAVEKDRKDGVEGTTEFFFRRGWQMASMKRSEIPQPSAMKKAKKVGGSYQADGTIVSTFKTLTGEVRHVFEFDYPAGMLHIFGPSQVEIEGPVKVDSEDRTKWTYKQWWEHVGAWEDKDGQIVFGSPMAVRAMMIQFGRSLKGDPK